jgi:hypothetical protein
MATTRPIMTFQCPRCGTTTDLYVAPSGEIEASVEGTKIVFSIDYSDPRKSTAHCGCPRDGGAEFPTKMRLIGERDS